MKRLFLSLSFLLLLTKNAQSMNNVDPDIFDIYFQEMRSLDTEEARKLYIDQIEDEALRMALQESLLDTDDNDAEGDDNNEEGNDEGTNTYDENVDPSRALLKSPAPSLQQLSQLEKKVLGSPATQKSPENNKEKSIFSRVIDFTKSFFPISPSLKESSEKSSDNDTEGFVIIDKNEPDSDADEEAFKQGIALSLDKAEKEKSTNPLLAITEKSESPNQSSDEDDELARILEESKDQKYLGKEETKKITPTNNKDAGFDPRQILEVTAQSLQDRKTPTWETVQLQVDGTVMQLHGYQEHTRDDNFHLIQLQSSEQSGAECGYMAFINNLILNKFFYEKLYKNSDYQKLREPFKEPLLYWALPAHLKTLISEKSKRKDWITNEGLITLAKENKLSLSIATGRGSDVAITSIDEQDNPYYIVSEDHEGRMLFYMAIAENIKNAQETETLYLEHFIIDTNNYGQTQREVENAVEGRVSTLLEGKEAAEARKKTFTSHLGDGARGHYFSFIVAFIPGNTKPFYIAIDSLFNKNELKNETVQSLVQGIESMRS